MYKEKVRCNYCESVFYEDYIIAHTNGDQEICPVCGQIGMLIDVPKDEFPQYYNNKPKEN